MVITSVSSTDAVLGHAAHVVAAQVDQHDVLGPLLGSASSSSASRRSSSSVVAAAAGAGQRADGHLAVDHPDHDLRRTAHQRDARRADVEHERAGVDHPQRAVDLERMRPDRHLQPLAEDDLEDVAGPDVLDALLDGRLEVRLGEVRL